MWTSNLSDSDISVAKKGVRIAIGPADSLICPEGVFSERINLREAPVLPCALLQRKMLSLFIEIIRTVLQHYNCALVVSVIDLVSTKLRRPVRLLKTRDTFKPVTLDTNLPDQLNKLSPDLYEKLKERWKQKTQSGSK